MTANPDKLAREIAHGNVRCRGGQPTGDDRVRYHTELCDALTEGISQALVAFAEEKVKEAIEDCAKVAERLATGVAIQIGQDLFVLGGMTSNPVDAQRATATAIAAALRSREGGT